LATVGAALLNPLDDALDHPNEHERVIMLPWEQPGLSESVRVRMRALSQERSIFLAPPTEGRASFRFDLKASLPLLLEALRVDKRLDEQRNLLVPHQVSEEQFFTNYFRARKGMPSNLYRPALTQGTSARRPPAPTPSTTAIFIAELPSRPVHPGRPLARAHEERRRRLGQRLGSLWRAQPVVVVAGCGLVRGQRGKRPWARRART
jgi:hypothetical protein